MGENATSFDKVQEKKMRKLMALTFVGFVCSGLAGCGSGGSGGGGDNNALALCNDAVSVVCPNLFKCPGNLGTVNGYADVKDCETQLAADRCTPENANCAAGQTFQPSKAPACMTAYKNMGCDLLADPGSAIGQPAECQVVCASSP